MHATFTYITGILRADLGQTFSLPIDDL